MEHPNIIYIYADDLGKGMLSCYGQKNFKTPNIDRIANEGMIFTRAYANAFCAPARASLICGIHDAHAGRWSFSSGNVYKKISTGELTENQLNEILCNSGIDNNCKYLAQILKEKGYYTGEIGKLEWGFATCKDEIEKHGWDYHYGYYDHVRCHGYFPPFLFENGVKVDIEGNTDPHCGIGVDGNNPYGNLNADMSYRKQYSQDLFDEKIISFIEKHKNEKFFLFHPSQLPHGPVFYPDYHPQIKDRDDLLPIEKEYASMVLRLDDTVGKILNKIDELGISENTIVFFASDNGHEPGYYEVEGRTCKSHTKDGILTNDIDVPFRTKTHGDIFNGNDNLAGTKFSNWDGGNRVVLMVKWANVIEEGTVCNRLVSNYDTAATFADLVDNFLYNSDGVSFLPFLKGEDGKEHDYIVFSSRLGPALVTKEGYKIRLIIENELMKDAALGEKNILYDDRLIVQLYNILEDEGEEYNIADENPDIVNRLLKILLEECDGNFYNGTPNAHRSYYTAKIPDWDGIKRGEI